MKQKHFVIHIMNIFALTILLCLSMPDCLADQAPQHIGDTVIWRDVREFIIEGKGWDDTDNPFDRLPGRAKSKVPNSVWNLSHDSAGVTVRFVCNAPKIQVSQVIRVKK